MIDGKPNAFLQSSREYLVVLQLLGTDTGSVQRVAAIEVASVSPVEKVVLGVDFEVDRFRQVIDQQFDIRAILGLLISRNLKTGSEYAPLSTIRWTLLCPIDVAVDRINGNADAVAHNVLRIGRKHPVANENSHVRTVEIRTHDTHALAITPIQQSRVEIGRCLLWRHGETMTDQGTAIRAVEPDALDRSVGLEKFAFMRTDGWSHVCPVQCLGPLVDNDSVHVVEQIPKQSASIATIGIHLDDFAAWPVLENIEFSGTHGAPLLCNVKSKPLRFVRSSWDDHCPVRP